MSQIEYLSHISMFHTEYEKEDFIEKNALFCSHILDFHDDQKVQLENVFNTKQVLDRQGVETINPIESKYIELPIKMLN